MKINNLLCIVSTVLLLSFNSLLADNLFLRGLYKGSSELPLKYSGKILGYSYNETDTYTLDSAFGIGLEYEFKKPADSLAFSCGMDYFFQSDVPSVKYNFTSSYYGDTSGKTQLSVTDEHKYQATYFFSRIKYYFDKSLFIGGEASLPAITLIGDYWNDLKINGEIGLGFVLGYNNENYSAEFSYKSNPLALKIDSSDLDKKTNYTIAMFSVGYLIPLKKDKDSNLNKIETTNEETTMPEKETPKEILEKTAPTVSNTGNLEELEKLHTLKEKGIITEDEYNAKKKQILGL